VPDTTLSISWLCRRRRRRLCRRALSGVSNPRVRRIGVSRYALVPRQVAVCIAIVGDALGQGRSGGRENEYEGCFHSHSRLPLSRAPVFFARLSAGFLALWSAASAEQKDRPKAVNRVARICLDTGKGQHLFAPAVNSGACGGLYAPTSSDPFLHDSAGRQLKKKPPQGGFSEQS
jgi:hypothetical protein